MKKLCVFFLVLTLLAVFTIPAFASGGYPKIVDDADLLTTGEVAELETIARGLVEKYQMDVVIVTVDSMGYKTATEYADDYFDYNGYGIGSDHSGVLLLLSMEYRDWALSTCGESIDALSDYDQERIMDGVLDYFGDDEYYDGFCLYLEELDRYFEAYETGETVEDPIDLYDAFVYIVISLVIGLVAGLITITILKGQMKTVKQQRGAESYVVAGSFDLKVKQDRFLYSKTSKVSRSSDSGGSRSGGSSTHRSSSGRSHGGSRGKF